MEIDYYKLVENCASKKLDVEIANGQIDHAQILLEAMLRHGKKSIKIFTGALREELYSDFKFKVSVKIYFLISIGTLTFLIQNIDNLKEHELYKLARELDPKAKRITFHILNNSSDAGDETNHFAVMDNLAYRLEIDDERVEAKANFNDEKQNQELTKKFDTYLNQSIHVAA
jgi:hypothetical protein